MWLCHCELDRTGLASPVIPLVNPNDLIDLINFYGTKTISLAFVVRDETGQECLQCEMHEGTRLVYS